RSSRAVRMNLKHEGKVNTMQFYIPETISSVESENGGLLPGSSTSRIRNATQHSKADLPAHTRLPTLEPHTWPFTGSLVLSWMWMNWLHISSGCHIACKSRSASATETPSRSTR